MYVSPKAKAGQSWKLPGKGKGKKSPDNGARTSFPSYDDRKPADMAIVPLSERRLEGPASGSDGTNNIVRTVQSAVNQARKLDSKVQRLQREFAERKLQWDAYVEEMKQTLKKEKKRFINDQNATAQALREAQEAQSAAHLQLQHSLATKDQEPATADTTMGCEEWQDILQTLDAPPILSGSVNLQQLTQALLAAGVPLDTPERTAPATPPRRSTRPLPMTPPTSSKSSLPPQSFLGQVVPTMETALSKDPYMQSPSLAHFGMPLSPGSAATAPPGLAPSIKLTTTADTAEDTTVEDAPGAPSLSEKLSEKRRTKRAALAPFGVESRRLHTAPPDQEQGLIEAPPPTTFLDDDGEEELDAASPGLGNLE